MLSEEVREGRLDGDAVRAVLPAAGAPMPPLARPLGPQGQLTEREVDVLRLISGGMATKQVANRLGISPKTADRHIQNLYAKIGVSTRAGAAVFAMEHGLVGLSAYA